MGVSLPGPGWCSRPATLTQSRQARRRPPAEHLVACPPSCTWQRRHGASFRTRGPRRCGEHGRGGRRCGLRWAMVPAVTTPAAAQCHTCPPPLGLCAWATSVRTGSAPPVHHPFHLFSKHVGLELDEQGVLVLAVLVGALVEGGPAQLVEPAHEDTVVERRAPPPENRAHPPRERERKARPNAGLSRAHAGAQSDLARASGGGAWCAAVCSVRWGRAKGRAVHPAASSATISEVFWDSFPCALPVSLPSTT